MMITTGINVNYNKHLDNLVGVFAVCQILKIDIIGHVLFLCPPISDECSPMLLSPVFNERKSAEDEA